MTTNGALILLLVKLTVLHSGAGGNITNDVYFETEEPVKYKSILVYNRERQTAVSRGSPLTPVLISRLGPREENFLGNVMSGSAWKTDTICGAANPQVYWDL